MIFYKIVPFLYYYSFTMKNILILTIFLFISTKLICQQQIETNKTVKTPFLSAVSDYPGKYFFSISTGYSNQTFPELFYTFYNSSDSYKRFTNGLINGFYNSIEAAYFFKRIPNLGLGLKYSKTFCSSSASDISFNNENKPIAGGSLYQKMNYGFFGPQLSARTLFLKKNFFCTKISLGCVYFNQYTHSSNEVLERKFTIQSKSVGINFEIGYDYLISKHLALGLQAEYGGGAFSEYKLKEYNKVIYIPFGDEHEPDLSPLSIAVGIRYNF